MAKYTRKQLYILASLIIGYLCCALCYSIQAPFFPQEAEKKGATPSQYGLVFGAYDLTLLIMTPVWGKFIPNIGPKFIVTAGVFLVGGACILFGQLDRFNTASLFIGFAFAIRIVESFGNSGFFIAAFSFIARDFPDNVASVFSFLEAFFGFGMIIGPSVGGVLYTYGGYSLPFTVLGSVLIAATILLYLALPSDDQEEVIARGSFLGAFKIEYIALSVTSSAVTCYGLGCIEVGLAQHLAALNLNPLKIGLVFIVYGGIYAITTPIWGIVIDRGLSSKNSIIIGSLLMAISFIILGPAPFIPINPTVWLIIVSLIIQGLGLGGSFVGTYILSMDSATSSGMPNNISTFGIISGVYMFAVGLGFTVGPSISGYVIEILGFRWATFIAFLTHILVITLFAIKEATLRRSNSKRDDVNYELVDKDSELYGTFEQGHKQLEAHN